MRRWTPPSGKGWCQWGLTIRLGYARPAAAEWAFERALSLLGLLLHHSATEQEVKDSANKLLAKLAA